MSRSWPDLDDLALLVLVSETGSFGQAAAASGLTQPSVSRRVAALERVLKVSVFRRSPRGSELTPAGRVVVDWAARVLDAAEEFNRSVETLRSRRRVAVRAAVSMTIAEHLAPRWLQQLKQQSPGTVVALTVANSTDVAQMVQAGRVDIGFLESPTVRSGLRTRRIGSDDLVVAVAPGHPWARRTRVSAAELAQTPLLVREQGSGTRETIEYALSQAGLELLPGMELASNTALKSAAVTGVGPVVVSGLALTQELAGRALVQVRVHGIDLSRPLTAVWRRDADLSEEAVALYGVARAGRVG